MELFGAFGLTVSEKTESLVIRVNETEQPLPPPPAPPLVVEAAGQRYAQTTEVWYLGGIVNKHGDNTREIKYRDQSSEGVLQEVRPRALRPAGSTVPTQNLHSPEAEAIEALLPC